jgi:hypothetical protein
VSGYLNGLATSAASVKLTASAIRHWLDFLTERGVLPFNPALSVRTARLVVTEGKTPVLEREEARALFAALDAAAGDGDLLALRDRAMFAVMLFGFVRVGALCKMTAVCISLWGLKFKFPEDFLSKDILDGLRRVRDSERQLAAFDGLGHAALSRRRDEIISQREFCARSCILASFNLIEAFLNGLAWDFAHDAASMARLSKRQQELISDSHGATLREKIAKYPDIIAGKPLALGEDLLVVAFLEDMKPLRDALVHPSPFSSPAKFGGRDKLRAFYRADAESAEPIAAVAIEIITKVWEGVTAGKARPGWLSELRNLVGERIGDESREWGLVASVSPDERTSKGRS